MNKKILGTALLAGMAIGMGSTAFAESLGEHGKTVEFSQSSTYNLTIPADVTLTETVKSVDVQFGTASRNVEVGKRLELSIKWTAGDTNKFELLNTEDNSIKIPTKITKGGSSGTPVVNGAIQESYEDVNLNPDVKTYTIAFEDQSLVPRAGTYKNTLTFVGEVK